MSMDIQTNESKPEMEIDESLYSRQLYVLGAEAMKKMSASNVLIIGLKGLGCEIAKNVALAGVKSVTLYDPAPVTIQDLGTQFFLTENDLGKPRALATAARLSELNPYVAINHIDSEPNPEDFSNYKVIVVTETSIKKQFHYNQICRDLDVYYISAETHGLFSSVFNDFGDNFFVEDPTGESSLSGIVASIDNDVNGIVTCLDETRHGLEDGDYVTFSEVKGMESLNGCDPIKIKVWGPYSFSIGDTSKMDKYTGGGIFTQNPLKQAIENPDFLFTDFAKLDRPSLAHLSFRALHEFFENHQRFPLPADDSDYSEVLKIAHSINNSNQHKIDIDEKILKAISYQATGDLAPMNAVIGGFVAQEVLKACTGKFTPLNNYMYFDSLESLPTDFIPSKEECAQIGSRYDGQIAVFGKSFQEKIENYRQFLVGSGAIGCEMLKNWAMMGLATGEKGMIHVTDMDTIEKSNLNRQFLFRSYDVGKLKSEVASKAVISMNNKLEGKIKSYHDRVGVETEEIFDDDFFGSLDCVTNALDNMEARMYMDRRCVMFRKPLLESGTLGSKGNTQVVVPFLTESYSASRDPPEKSIPMCTLHNFPNAVEHTIQWARDRFHGFFFQPAENVNAFLTQPDYVENIVSRQGESVQIETFESIKQCLVDSKPENFSDCIKWARHTFDELFDHNIQQLLFNFPRDSLTNSGQLFWSPPKRAPTPIKFDPKNPTHVDFIVSAANIRASLYGITQSRDVDSISEAASHVESIPFTPKSGVVIKVNDSDPDAEPSNVVNVQSLISSLPSPSSFSNFRMIPSEFEKDDDKNFHIDFITATSNLRAQNYEISPADRFKTKQIAGKIIPAIATTTSVVSGLICLELYKILDKNHKIEDFKNGFINLALPFFAFSEPIAPETRDFNGTKVSDWDAIFIERDLTLQELIDEFEGTYKMEISMVTSGTTMLFSPFLSKKKAAERKSLKISELVSTISKKQIPSHTKYLVLVICCYDENDEDIDVPEIRVRIRA
ncbi:Ubiquitin-activating enzyme E1 1 [Smittium mucronatum]|uniref:Ubiquitin-activating enzyme E1 1 n=2 Tax=Smittium mucronatum TaxID=133383 RepID=A0A1R0H932_9FUNG|nr:Ubiquitin-activating enzyme E1 1 [Smittium mucronatum]